MKINKGATLLVLLLACFSGITGQNLIINPPSLDFGDVFENDPDSIMITVVSPFPDTLTVEEVRLYDFYGEPAFIATDTSFVLPPGQAKMMHIVFAPRHNMYHNSKLVFITDSRKGSVSVQIEGQGKYSNPYYDNTEGLVEQELKDSLKAITGRSYIELTFTTARNNMFAVIDNWRINGQGAMFNTVQGVYSGQILQGYINPVDAINQGYNIGTTFPGNMYNAALPMASDIFHLVIARIPAINHKANLPFGVVTGTPVWTLGDAKEGPDSFEPRDDHKGAAARTMMYFVTRYQDYPPDSAGTTGFYELQDSILRAWHREYPPVTAERRRNNDIFGFQNNRNPFIDYPQFTRRISTIGDSLSVEPDLFGFDLPDTTIFYGDVPASTDANFQFLIINTGNRDLMISNLTLNDTSLQFSSLANDTVILPGEDLPLSITVNATDTVMSTLTFESNVPGQTMVSVPVISYTPEPVIDAIVPEVFNDIEVYPNPVGEILYVEIMNGNSAEFSYELIDVAGKVQRSGSLAAIIKGKGILMEDLPAGIYYLRLATEKETHSWKILAL